MCIIRQIISVPAEVIDSCVPVHEQICVSVFENMPHYPVTNTHTSEKSVFDEDANLFSLERQRMCWGYFKHSYPLFHGPHQECTTSEYLRRSGQDHLCPPGTCCVPVEQNNGETNFLFCQSYVNHVIRKCCQNTLSGERKGNFILRKYWSFTAFIAFDCHLF